MLQCGVENCGAKLAALASKFGEQRGRLLAALWVALANQRQHQLLEQRGFAFGRLAPCPKMSRLDASFKETSGSASDGEI